MRVDDVPFLARPLFHAYGYGLGAALQSVSVLLRHGCHYERVASSALTPRIECIWHEHLPTYLARYLPASEGRRYVWMNHPIWYMRPVHVLLLWGGVEEVVLGSSGHDGKKALSRLVELLRGGRHSTLLAVDGPAGPPHVLKRGALDLARATGLPIVAIRFEYERALRLRSWDRKQYPLLGSKVRVVESEPIYVREGEEESTTERLRLALG